MVFFDVAFYAAIAPLLPDYVADFGLSKAEAGILAAAYAAGTLLASLPAGFVATWIGPRRTVISGLLLLGGSSLVFGLGAEIALLGAIAAEVGTELVFGAVLGVAALLAAFAARLPEAGAPERQSLREVAAAIGSRPILTGTSFVAVPSLLFGVLEVLVPLRIDELGGGHVAIAAGFIVAGGRDLLRAGPHHALGDSRCQPSAPGLRGRPLQHGLGGRAGGRRPGRGRPRRRRRLRRPQPRGRRPAARDLGLRLPGPGPAAGPAGGELAFPP